MSTRLFKKVYGNDDLKASPESEDEQPVAFASTKKGHQQVRNAYELVCVTFIVCSLWILLNL
jgi:hypothetical protein